MLFFFFNKTVSDFKVCRINRSQLDNTVGLPNSYSLDIDFISGRYYAIQFNLIWSTFEQ